jgi:hypothetical protein
MFVKRVVGAFPRYCNYNAAKYDLFCSVEDKTHRRQCKMSSSKKLTCKGALRQMFICLRPRTPYTLYTCIHYTVLSTTHREAGEGGRGEPERRLEWQQLTKLVENTNQHDCLYHLSIYSDKHLQKIPFLG